MGLAIGGCWGGERGTKSFFLCAQDAANGESRYAGVQALGEPNKAQILIEAINQP